MSKQEAMEQCLRDAITMLGSAEPTDAWVIAFFATWHSLKGLKKPGKMEVRDLFRTRGLMTPSGGMYRYHFSE